MSPDVGRCDSSNCRGIDEAAMARQMPIGARACALVEAQPAAR
jgi:hypothetical protein